MEDATERNKKAPYTFYIPSKEVIEILKTGDQVKLLFASNEIDGDFEVERMWVEISERDGELFSGILVNTPASIKNLEMGHKIRFKREHISDTEYKDPEEEAWDYYFDSKVVVSKDVLKRNEYNFMLRDFPKGEGDTGWAFSSGYENDEFLSNSENLQVISLGVILNIDDSILAILDDHPQCVYERDPETNMFRKIHDFDWDYYNGT
ncbi:hypothetical protein J53TS2_29540 [Paenibacillus sp. J53TS2]|nr:hypothetical protein J53TS2_29540 [Paenibacillus sp. J53TS2]